MNSNANHDGFDRCDEEMDDEEVRVWANARSEQAPQARNQHPVATSHDDEDDDADAEVSYKP
jgi:hypothetical protein